MKYDITVIGSGPGGYVAAIRCAQLGFKTAIIEKYSTLGGTCLNVGCIPSKALLDSSEHYHNAKHTFNAHGINISELSADLAKMVDRKNGVVKMTCDGINFLMKKNKIDVYTGVGTFINKNLIKVTGAEEKEIETDKVIIATGSKPVSIPGVEIDKKRIISSTEALNLKELPKHIIIIGGGVIGLELGSVYARLGSKVSVIEFMPSIIPFMDEALAKELSRSLRKLGFEFFLSHKVISATNNGHDVTVTAENEKGEVVEFKGDYCLVSIGRRAFTTGLGLENIAINTDKKGCIEVDENLETEVKGIYAIGDVVKGAMLAHKAEEEGVFVAEKIAGKNPHINYNLIPGVVYTWPEVAAVGATEQELKLAGKNYKVGSFPMRALGRARASMDIDGLIKVIADAETDQILGVHMIGARAADMIAEAVIAMEFKAKASEIGRMSHAHPTYTEAFKEACLAVNNEAIHV